MNIKCLRIIYLEHEKTRKYEKVVQNIKPAIKAHSVLRLSDSSYLQYWERGASTHNWTEPLW